MGTTTFSGPIRAGNIRTGASTNVGYMVSMQAHTIDVSGGAIAQSDTAMIIPANSAIVDVIIDVVSAIGGNASVLSLGTSGGNDNTILDGFSCATGAGQIGRKYPTTEAGATRGWANIGTSDLKVTVKTTGASNAGSIRVTILYAQAYNTTIQP
tara:strand:- start:279 stop:740 length:462 start_codon:yes stop_codon:yes gene_type:complete